MSTGCKGCTMYENDTHCIIIENKKDGKCPCKNCLVKVVCEYSCEEYDEYIENLDS